MVGCGGFFPHYSNIVARRAMHPDSANSFIQNPYIQVTPLSELPALDQFNLETRREVKPLIVL